MHRLDCHALKVRHISFRPTGADGFPFPPALTCVLDRWARRHEKIVESSYDDGPVAVASRLEPAQSKETSP